MDKVDQSFESINDPDAKECSIVDSTEIKKINYKTYTNLLSPKHLRIERKDLGEENEENTRPKTLTTTHTIIPVTSNNYINNIEDQLIKETYSKAEYTVKFNFPFFLRNFILHSLYFMLLGPFLNIFILPIFGYAAVKNMQFIGSNMGFGLQTSVWLLYIISIIIYFGFPSQEASSTLIFILTLSLLFRITVISVRYGYTSQFRMKQMYATNLTAQNITDEFILGGWNNMTPPLLTEEIKAACWRLNIREFVVSFSHRLNDDWKDRLSNPNYHQINEYNFSTEKKELNKRLKAYECKENNIRRGIRVEGGNLYIVSGIDKSIWKENKPFLYPVRAPSINELNNKYSGISFTRELYLYSKLRAETYMGTMAALSLIHCILPFIWNLAVKDTFLGETTGQIIVLITHTLLSLFLFAINVLNLSGSEIDLQRKMDCCQLLAKLIQWGRTDRDWLPSLDILSPMNIHNWYVLRRVILDIGLKYYVRGITYNSLCLIFIFPLFFFFLMIYFDIININYPDYWIVGLFDILFFLGRVYYIIYLSARVNDQFGVHRDILTKILILITKLKTNVIYLSSMKAESRDHMLSDMLLGDVYLEQFIGRYGLKGGGLESLDLVMEHITHIIRSLEIDELRNSITFLGFKPTFTYLKGSLGTLLTIIFIAVNKALGFMLQQIFICIYSGHLVILYVLLIYNKYLFIQSFQVELILLFIYILYRVS